MIATSKPVPRLSDQLRRIADQFGERSVSLGEVGLCLQGRGWYGLLVLLSIPFLTPVPLPLVSTPVGVVMGMIGLRLMAGREPQIPERYRHKQLPPRFFPAVFAGSAWVIRQFERVLRPRWRWMRKPLTRRIGGAMITGAAMLLLLPLPVPFSNFLPAFTVVLLSAAALSRDGLCFLAGMVMFLTSLAFFGALPFGGEMLVKWMTGH